MYITRRNLEALQEIVMTQTREQLARLRSAIPDDKEPFDFEKFLNLSYGDDFGKTPEKLELSYYTSFASSKTLRDFVSAMVEYTY